MDPIAIEKFQAMKRYRRNHFLQSLLQYSLTAFVLGLFVSKGLASLCSYMKLFFFVCIPKMGAFVVGPKCLFVISNIIVIYLVGESKLGGSSSSSDSPTSEIYDDYMKHCRSLRRLSTSERKDMERKMEVPLIEENVEEIKEPVVEAEEKKGVGGADEVEEEENKKKGEWDLDGEEEHGWPTDVLNKKVEDFIAKVKKERMLEAGMLVCSG